MGIRYSAAESALLIQTLTNQVQIANEITDRLSSGCDHLIKSLESGELQGAAYTAGKGLFTEVIIPSLKKLQLAVDDIQVELTSYKTADSTVAEYGMLDMDQLYQLKNLRENQLEITRKQIDENNQFIRQAEALFTGELVNLWNQTTALYEIEQHIVTGLWDIQEQIDKLDAFVTQVSPYFTDSLEVLYLAIQGATQLSQIVVDSEGCYYTDGLDMTWVSKMQQQSIKSYDSNSESKKYQEKRLAQKIQQIQNSSLSDLEKSEQIVAAYEDYLYNLNKEALDAYWEIRKDYSGKWDSSSDEFVRRTEDELGKKLQASGIDILSVLNQMGDAILTVNSNANYVPYVASKPAAVFSDQYQFYNLVQTGQPLDLKSRSYGTQNYSIWSRQWTTDLRGDYAGNYLYGYVGAGFLSSSDAYLKLAAGAAQGISDNDPMEWLDSISRRQYGDKPGDAAIIQDGIDAYKRKND
ncbi:polymorphic toxin type 44 domain-containing protein [Streptococcus suis]